MMILFCGDRCLVLFWEGCGRDLEWARRENHFEEVCEEIELGVNGCDGGGMRLSFGNYDDHSGEVCEDIDLSVDGRNGGGMGSGMESNAENYDFHLVVHCSWA